jgi:hypothetical protein
VVRLWKTPSFRRGFAIKAPAFLRANQFATAPTVEIQASAALSFRNAHQAQASSAIGNMHLEVITVVD